MKRVTRALRLVISAGPTREPIDPVRFLSNYSTGYMGACLAAEALFRGHRVTVISGPGVEAVPPGARVIPVERSQEMEAALRRAAARADAIIMAAAVADFRPTRPNASKRPRRARLTLFLKATPDIIGRLPRHPGQVVAGFALETGPVPGVLQRAAKKLRAKRLDLVLAQQTSPAQVPFGRRRVRAWLLARDESIRQLGRCSKVEVARALLDKIEVLWYGQSEPMKG